MAFSHLIVIPLYNHAAMIGGVLDAVAALDCSLPVLVVDDGSTDGGGGAVECWMQARAASGVNLIRHAENRGKGVAIQSAAAWAEEHGFSHMITLDADGQHKAEDIPRLLEASLAAPRSIIVGGRDFSVPDVPFASRFGRAFSGFWMRVQTGQSAPDMQSGFRAYPVALLRSLRCVEKRFAYEMEVLVKAAWSGVGIVTVPVAVHYPPARERVSHFRKVHDNVLISLMNTRLTIRALLPVPFLQREFSEEAKVSLRSPLASLRLLLSAENTPFVLALSTFTAVLINILPLPGLQCILTLLCIARFRLNRTWTLALHHAVWPPLFIPFCLQGGHWLRTGALFTDVSWNTLAGQAGERVWEWALGALVLGPVAAFFCALAVYGAALRLNKSLRAQGAEHAR